MQNIYWDWYTAGISIQFYTHIGLHGYGLGYRIHQYNRTTERDGHPMDIRWTSDGHPMFDTGERALQQDEPRAATIKVISATAKVRPCHVTCMWQREPQWLHVTACDSTMCLALFGFFHRISRASKDHLQVPQHLAWKAPTKYFRNFLDLTPRECFGMLNTVLKCHENQWEPMRTNENQLAMCQKKRGS